MLSKYLQEECIQTGLHAADKPAVLKAIAHLAKRNLLLHAATEEEILLKLLEREKVVSTGIGNGIAIPHCILESVRDFVVGIVVAPEGVDFGALDGRKTKIFVFIIAPPDKRDEHIRVLSRISNVVRFPENVRDILNGRSAAEIRERFLRHVPAEVEQRTPKDYKQITVIVQREDLLQDILTILAEIPESFIAVVEAGNVGKYLYASPLFAHFRKEESQGRQALIIATVNALLVDEALRRINLIIDGKSGKSGVLVFFQDITYLNGALNL